MAVGPSAAVPHAQRCPHARSRFLHCGRGAARPCLGGHAQLTRWRHCRPGRRTPPANPNPNAHTPPLPARTAGVTAPPSPRATPAPVRPRPFPSHARPGRARGHAPVRASPRPVRDCDAQPLRSPRPFYPASRALLALERRTDPRVRGGSHARHVPRRVSAAVCREGSSSRASNTRAAGGRGESGDARQRAAHPVTASGCPQQRGRAGASGGS